MKADTVLQLQVAGGQIFAFSRFEIPGRIQFGGRQKLAVHEQIGGRRVVDAMGRSDAPLSWSGLLQGTTALERARFLDYLRISGKQCTLTWSEFIYTVVVEEFTADFERFYQLPYRISFMVVADETTPIDVVSKPGIDELIGDDMATAKTYGVQIGDGPLSATLAALDSAISAVSSFANATQGTINSVLGPIAAVTSRIGILIATANNTITNTATMGGVLPNSSIAQQAANLNSQTSAVTQQPALYNLNALMGRMSNNLTLGL